MITPKCDCKLCSGAGCDVHQLKIEVSDHHEKVEIFDFSKSDDNCEEEFDKYLDNMVTEEQKEGSFVNISLYYHPYLDKHEILSIIKHNDGLFWVCRQESGKEYGATVNKSELNELINYMQNNFGEGIVNNPHIKINFEKLI